MWDVVKRDLAAVFERDPAATGLIEVLLTYSGFHAILLHRVSHGLWCLGLRLIPRWLSQIGRFLTGVEIHPAARIGHGFFIDHGMGVVIGETAEIGDDCTLYHGVTLGGTSWHKGKRHPTLGNGVVLGAGAKILGPITIGDGARVGSNAVVVKSVPPGATAIGIPAHIVEKEAGGKGGFSAYAVGADMNDPLVKALHELINHSVSTDQRIDRILEQLERLGVGSGEVAERDQFDANYLNKIVD